MQTLCVKNLTWKNTTYNNKTTKNQAKHTRRILILKKKPSYHKNFKCQRLRLKNNNNVQVNLSKKCNQSKKSKHL